MNTDETYAELERVRRAILTTEHHLEFCNPDLAELDRSRLVDLHKQEAELERQLAAA